MSEVMVGHTVVQVRPMTKREREMVGFVKDEYEDRECCAAGVAVLVLSNGATVFAACDPELNDGGHLVTTHRGKLYDIFT